MTIDVRAECFTPCLEAVLSEAKQGSSVAVVALYGIYEAYGEGRVTDGYPVPLVPCPLRECGRERTVEFVDENKVVTTDSDPDVGCRRGLRLTIIEPVPVDIVDREKPEPPLPPLALAG